MPREFVTGAEPDRRGFSRAVATRGGKTLWLAGVGRYRDEEGRPLAEDFEAQVRATFRFISGVLERAGGALADVTVMTVFLKDGSLSDRFVEVRREFFPENFPASALITVAGFDHPDMLLEVQAVAVVGEE